MRFSFIFERTNTASLTYGGVESESSAPSAVAPAPSRFPA